jgi:hypothetical protein
MDGILHDSSNVGPLGDDAFFKGESATILPENNFRALFHIEEGWVMVWVNHWGYGSHMRLAFDQRMGKP